IAFENVKYKDNLFSKIEIIPPRIFFTHIFLHLSDQHWHNKRVARLFRCRSLVVAHLCKKWGLQLLD
ncbi:MAG: hypothetical protein LWW85_03045, partial [Marinilabiliales bacterium]|nr:hypothetical protein [Marinilabiliales bacterium]